MSAASRFFRIAVLGLLFVPVVALADWGGVKGDGHAQRQARTVVGFTKVANDTSLDLDITQGDKFDVQVTLDGNLLPLLTTTVDAGTLRIRSEKSIEPTGKGLVRIVLPKLAELDVSGSGDSQIHALTGGQPFAAKLRGSGSVSADQIATGDLDLASSGSGSIKLRGTAAKLGISVSGSGTVTANELSSTAADISLSGSGRVRVTVNGNLQVKDLGSGDVQATVNGGVIDVSLMGSGQVEWSGSGHEGKITKLGSGQVVHRNSLPQN